jgi:uroporphyrinogen-III synthase
VAEGRRRVLITRPEPGAGETAERIRELGFEPVQAPMLRVKVLRVKVWTGRLPGGGIQAVLATSGNAIAGLSGMNRSIRLLAVGDATADRARAAGFTNVASAGGDAGDLAELVSRSLVPREGPLLLACGRGHGLPLAATLRGAGFRVLRRIVYAAEPVRDLTAPALIALRAGQVRAALFFSAETARQFVLLACRHGLQESVREVAALAISAPVGVALSVLPWGDVLIAARPNQDELLALLR